MKIELRLLIRGFSLVNSFSIWKYNSNIHVYRLALLLTRGVGIDHCDKVRKQGVVF